MKPWTSPARVGLLAVLALCLLAGRGLARNAPWDIEQLPSNPAPAFKLADLEGNKVSSAAFSGKVLLINFWATWCGPCRQEMPALEAVSQRYRDKGLVVIGIAIDSDLAPVKQFVGQTKLGFPILHDPDMHSHDDYKVYTYPTTFLVDRQGVIRRYWLESQDWDGEEFRKILQDALR